MLFIVLAGGPYDSDPTNITFGGLAFLPPEIRAITLVETHLTAGCFRFEAALPGSCTLTVTWPEADGFSLRARLLTMLFVSDQSGRLKHRIRGKREHSGCGWRISMQIDSAPNDIVLIAVWSPVLAVTDWRRPASRTRATPSWRPSFQCRLPGD